MFVPFIRIPTNERVHGALVPWIAWAARSFPAADISITYTHGYGIAWGRNQIVREFIAAGSQFTHLWMIDADVIPARSEALIRAAIEHPVVAAPYLTLHPETGLSWTIYRHVEPANGRTRYHPMDVDEWPLDVPTFHADAAGLGCTIIAKYFVEAGAQFLHRGLDTETPTGEDFEFFQAIGGVEIVPSAACQHARIVDLLELWQRIRAREIA